MSVVGGGFLLQCLDRFSNRLRGQGIGRDAERPGDIDPDDVSGFEHVREVAGVGRINNTSVLVRRRLP